MSLESYQVSFSIILQVQIIDPSEGLFEVFFHNDLPIYINKQKNLSAILKQAAHKRMFDIPMDAVQVFTDGSKNDDNCTGNGKYVKSHKQEIKILKRNVNFCSVFRCELSAIDEGHDLNSSLPLTKEIWILTGSKSVV